jgi:hypothetical protein
VAMLWRCGDVVVMLCTMKTNFFDKETRNTSLIITAEQEEGREDNYSTSYYLLIYFYTMEKLGMTAEFIGIWGFQGDHPNAVHELDAKKLYSILVYKKTQQ